MLVKKLIVDDVIEVLEYRSSCLHLVWSIERLLIIVSIERVLSIEQVRYNS